MVEKMKGKGKLEAILVVKWICEGEDSLILHVGVDERCDVQASYVLDVDEPFCGY